MSTPSQPHAPGTQFNTPPNWPANPPGWSPEPGWQPDPAWGPAPDGWLWWVPAQSPAPATEATASPTVMTPQQHHVFTSARNYFLIGAAVAIAAAITTLVAASKGGTIWTGGFLLGLILWIRAGRSVMSLRSAGVSLSRTVIAGTAVVASITLILAGAAGIALMNAKNGSGGDSVGSCFSDNGSKILHVSCSSKDATWVATAKATGPDQCPDTSFQHGDVYLCVTRR